MQKNKNDSDFPLSFGKTKTPKLFSQLALPENPIPKNEMNDFFIRSFLIVTCLFFLLGGLIYLLELAPFMRTWFFRIDYNGSSTLRIRSLFFIGSGFIVIPMYQIYGFDRKTLRGLLIYSLTFIVYIAFYLTVVTMAIRRDLFIVPLISTGASFLICALIGFFISQIFYLKLISYLKLVIGFFIMVLFHHYENTSMTSWFVAFPIFFVYDFIAADKYKLIYVANQRNMNLRDKLFLCCTAIFMVIPIHSNSLPEKFTYSRKWMTKWD